MGRLDKARELVFEVLGLYWEAEKQLGRPLRLDESLDLFPIAEADVFPEEQSPKGYVSLEEYHLQFKGPKPATVYKRLERQLKRNQREVRRIKRDGGGDWFNLKDLEREFRR